MKYEKLVSQLEKVRLGKIVDEPLDYGTDSFTDDWLQFKFEDWEKKISDLLDRIQAVKIDLSKVLDSEVEFVSNPIETVYDQLSNHQYFLSKDLDPFTEPFDPFAEFPDPTSSFLFKRPDGKIVKVEGKESYKRLEKFLSFFHLFNWLDKQQSNLCDCSNFYDTNKDKEPFVLGNLASIPFFGNQDSFIVFLYLMEESQFFLTGRHTDAKKMEQYEINTKEKTEFDRFANITKGEFSKLCARYFHLIEINSIDKRILPGGKRELFKKRHLNPTAIHKNMNNSSGNDLDSQTLNDFIDRFSDIIKKLEGFKEEKGSKSK